MNSERFSQNDYQQAPFSPKKKLHVKDKCSLADTVTNARENLKNAKDISARNLFGACSTRSLMSNPSLEGICNSDDECDGGTDSDSSLDEIVAIEEENTDYVSEKDLFDSDDDEEIIEEIVEEYYEEELVADDGDDSCYDSEDSELEPLPPPIVIPDSLKVKDSDDEESCNNNNVDDEDDDDSGYDDPPEQLPQFQCSDQRTKPPSTAAPIVTKAASERQHERPKHESMRPSAIRGFSIGSPTKTSEVPKTPTPESPRAKAPQTPTKESPPPKATRTPTKEAHLSTPKAQKTSIEASQPSTPKTQKTSTKESQPTTPKAPKTPTKESKPTTPRTIAAAVSADSFKGHENRLRPGAVRGFSFSDDEVDAPSAEKRAGRNPFTKPSLPLEEKGEIPITPPPSDSSPGVWKKPEWTKNNKLRSTGKVPSENLARPITSLPRGAPQSPNTTSAAKTTSAPKTAPQAPRKKYTAATPPPVNARSVDDDAVPDKIGWEKPEWTKRKVLRKTSKTETVFSGGSIERPIGGIRPIEEN